MKWPNLATVHSIHSYAWHRVYRALKLYHKTKKGKADFPSLYACVMKENAPLRRQKDIKSDHLTYVYMHASEDENIQPLTDTVEKFLLSNFFWSPTPLLVTFYSVTSDQLILSRPNGPLAQTALWISQNGPSVHSSLNPKWPLSAF